MIFELVIGAALLFLGRQLFCLFIGGAGFVAGLTFADRITAGEPEWLVLAVGLACGLVGVLVGIFIQKLALGIAGFLCGGYLIAEFKKTAAITGYRHR